MLDKNRANGVNGVMPRQTLAREACHRPNNRLAPFCNLILDYRVECGVCLHIRKLDASPAMIRFRELYPFQLVEREPVCGHRRDIRVVGIPSESRVMRTHRGTRATPH